MFITMPQLGETVTEGTIVRWCKAVGDAVAEDEPLFEVSTDKVDTEVPSAVAGVLSEILVAEGDTASVGARLAVVRTDGRLAGAGRAGGGHASRRTLVPASRGRERRSDAVPDRASEAATVAASHRARRSPAPTSSPASRHGSDRWRARPASTTGRGSVATVPVAGRRATASSRSRRSGAPPAPTCAGRSRPPRTRSS